MKQSAHVKTLAALSVLAGLSSPQMFAQEYDPSGILDQHGLIQGDIVIDTSDKHGVAISTEATEGTQTKLEGDIHISVDRDKENSTELLTDPSHGIYLSDNPGSLISLATKEEGDQIKIDVYNMGGAGIMTAGYQSGNSVLIDGSASSSPIQITLHNTATEHILTKEGRFGAITTKGLGVTIMGADVEIETHSSSANGLYLEFGRNYTNGTIDIERDLKITTHGEYAKGIYADYVTSAPGKDSVIVRGKTNIETNGMLADGILAGGVGTFHDDVTIKTTGNASAGVSSLGDLNFLSNLNIETNGDNSYGMAISMGTNDVDPDPIRMIVHGDTVIKTTGNTSHGLFAILNINGSPENTGATQAVVKFMGHTQITTTGEMAHGLFTLSKSTHVEFGNATIQVDSTKGSFAVWSQRGNITGDGILKIMGDIATSSGIVDLNMTGDSLLTGKSYLSSTEGAELKLTLSDTSRWVVTSDSSLTELTLNAGSSLALTITDLTDFTDITATVIALAQGSVINIGVNESFTVSEGDTFKIFTAGSLFDGGVAVIGGLDYGLAWDTSRLASEGIIEAVGSQPIPEPAGAALVFLGLAGLLVRRRQ